MLFVKSSSKLSFSNMDTQLKQSSQTPFVGPTVYGPVPWNTYCLHPPVFYWQRRVWFLCGRERLQCCHDGYKDIGTCFKWKPQLNSTFKGSIRQIISTRTVQP